MTICFKALAVAEVPYEVVYAVCFGFALIIYRTEGWFLKAPPFPWRKLWWVVGAAALCSIAGNWIGLFGLHAAPNPGYSAAIGVLQPLIITIIPSFWSEASVHRKLVAREWLGMLCAIIGTILMILLGNDVSLTTEIQSFDWIILSAISITFSAVFATLLHRLIQQVSANQLRHVTLTVRCALWPLITFGFLVAVVIRDSVFPRDPTLILLMLAAGALSAFANLCSFEAVRRAGGPALPYVVLGAQPVLIAVAAVALFGSPLTIYGVGGILLCICGVYFLRTSKA